MSVGSAATPGGRRSSMKRDGIAEGDAALPPTDDLSIESYSPLISPALLREEIPMTRRSAAAVTRGRELAADILSRRDDRLLVVVGPCSLHDPKAALEYGALLAPVAARLAPDLHIVMRAYFEKPRTTVGWKGLINDPDLNGSFNINKGLRTARRLLCDVTELGVPVGCELLDTISPQFIADLVSWGAIGARTTECQLHRELASGVSFPIGFKNGTNGDVQIAIDAMWASSHPHVFLGVNAHGLATICRTRGNDCVHMILRGGAHATNYDEQSVGDCLERIARSGVGNPAVMVDCSHGNSRKVHTNQPVVCAEVARQVANGNSGLVGVMIESNLKGGNQKLSKEGGLAALEYGQSITDACVSWADTVPMLEQLAQAVRDRRKHLPV
ncbi:unnamed protein product (mitochondrion) [Plasmodiophora brassicae]|uniref:3-deoxy-7-phosphoheptulonate synthase n=1 Tax=Plasmodiophora brassicae TaxID=37360 RepID=A0A0G4IK71_PLABS|nr:hypothetical protein PBRA_004260 [Plasmodiophora brassicae]SPR00409.1 unnamed protein product [Plasmodiophora brassicae]